MFVKDDGNVYDVGYHNFDQDMKMEEIHIDLLEADIPSKM
jgi:hypothetical protein